MGVPVRLLIHRPVAQNSAEHETAPNHPASSSPQSIGAPCQASTAA
jgi:hypothetical protein